NTNYILTYLIHRLGWVSFIIIMAIMAIFIIRSFILCSKQKSVLGRLVSTAVLITFTMEIVFYVINNLGFSIIISTLPFISYSGMSVIINMALIGIMLSVFKSGDIVKDELLLQKND
ncbi:MAG: FtsW/RodA/SpoVE family cell cycle protein, partial [Natronincolaceae bacterium]